MVPVHHAFSDVRPCETTFFCSPYLSTAPWSVERANCDETEPRIASISASLTKSSSVAMNGFSISTRGEYCAQRSVKSAKTLPMSPGPSAGNSDMLSACREQRT